MILELQIESATVINIGLVRLSSQNWPRAGLGSTNSRWKKKKQKLKVLKTTLIQIINLPYPKKHWLSMWWTKHYSYPCIYLPDIFLIAYISWLLQKFSKENLTIAVMQYISTWIYYDTIQLKIGKTCWRVCIQTIYCPILLHLPESQLLLKSSIPILILKILILKIL